MLAREEEIHQTLTAPAKTAVFKASYRKGVIKLAVEGEVFAFEPCRPGFYNLVRIKTNKVIKVVPFDIKTEEAAELCFKAIKEEKQIVYLRNRI